MGDGGLDVGRVSFIVCLLRQNNFGMVFWYMFWYMFGDFLAYDPHINRYNNHRNTR